MSSSEARALWPLAARPAFDELLARYGEPHRHYHTLTHVLDVLRALERPSLALSLAAWYHDAIYDSRASDNEERSADLLVSAALVPTDVAREAARLILLTKTHQADDPEGWALLDADLAILGADPADYDRYAAAIRLEYDWVPEPDYREGRAKVLRRFLERDQIYRTERMKDREPLARANLNREFICLVGADQGG